MQLSGAVTRQTVMSINQKYIQGPRSANNIASINNKKQAAPVNAEYASNKPVHSNASTDNSSFAQPLPSKALPSLKNTIQKGQKVFLTKNTALSSIEAKLGWNVLNPLCDVDVSAFLLNNNGKVLNDDWFVFYGQDTSPDGSTILK